MEKANGALISLPPEQLAACGNALTGSKITAPPIGRVLRPSRSAAARLLRLHSRACRLAETRHKLIANPEVARARAGIASRARQLPDGRRCRRQSKNKAAPRRYHGSVRGCVDRASWPTAEHARALLGGRCAGTNLAPTRYLLLRRLNMARSALRRADPATASVAEIARTHQFQEPGRFAVTYRTVFGEMPSSTLRRSLIKTT
jgi:hypothetical protein